MAPLNKFTFLLENLELIVQITSTIPEYYLITCARTTLLHTLFQQACICVAVASGVVNVQISPISWYITNLSLNVVTLANELKLLNL